METTIANKPFWNWGKGIGLLYLSFVALIVLMVVKSMQQNIDLVSEDYYDKELTFQKNIDAQSSANLLYENITITPANKAIIVDFGNNFKGKPIEGTAYFLCPSDKKKDVNVSFETLQQKTAITSEKLKHGTYMLRLSFVVDGKSYEVERNIFID
ncbi:MAG: FixH family protein [Chitinophagales bacterium]|nr:FixH family protein [Chitinophagales bacterium]